MVTMEKERAKQKGLSYCEKLLPSARDRYLRKLLDINDVDPYEVPAKQWCKDFASLPPISHGDLLNYFVFGVSQYTLQEFKAFKTLESYKQFVDGWVQEIYTHKPANCNNTVIAAKVMHSMRLNEKLLKPWIIADADGTIISAHCDCVAGVGETCTHVGAVLFKVDAIVRCREKTTVTGVPAYWMVPSSIAKVEPQVGYRIDYTPSTAKKKALDRALDGSLPGAMPVMEIRTGPATKTVFQAPDADELKMMLEELHLTGDKAAVLSVTPEYCEHFVDQTPAVVAPEGYSRFRNTKCDSKTLGELTNYCATLKDKIAITSEEAEKIERLTKQQANCNYWHQSRVGRITASNLHSVLATSTKHPAISTVRAVCYPSTKPLKVPAVVYGKQMEKEALARYKATVKDDHFEFMMEKSGLVVNPEIPFMAASPDSIVTCDCCGRGVVEVKCPYTHRKSTLEEAIQDKGFCLEMGPLGLSLKQHHPYYDQVQCQIFCTKSDYCDFVVFLEKHLAIVRVLPNEEWWDEKKNKAERFFYEVVLPELVAKYFTARHSSVLPSPRCPTKMPLAEIPQKKANTRILSLSPSKVPLGETSQNSDKKRAYSLSPQKNTSKKRYSTCRRGEDMDDMVACNNEKCETEWFHLRCVRRDSAPNKDDSWVFDIFTP